MVQNRLQLKTLASDPISSLVQEKGGPIDIRDIDEDAAANILANARPGSGRRRDAVAMQFRRQWYVNALYYGGIQNLEISQVLADIAPGIIETSGGYVANHIMRLVMGNVARLSSARIDWSVIPNTPDQVDQQAAKVGNHLLEHLQKQLRLNQKRLEICMHLDVFGTTFVYSGWDASKGQTRRFYFDPITKQPVAKQQMGPGQAEWLEKLGAYDDASDGDHDDEVLTPFDVWLPTRFKDLSKMPWVFIRRTHSLDEVWNRWPDKASELPGEGTEPDQGYDKYRTMLSSLCRREGLAWGSADQNDGSVDVDEFWMPPSKRMPSGLSIFGTGDTVLEVGPHKYAEAGLDTRFPLVDFHNIRFPGRFYGMSTVEHLIGPQTEYNRARVQIIKQRDVLSTPQWIAPIGTLKSVVRNETGDVIEYNPRIGKPELLSPPPLGEHLTVSGGQAQSDMQMIASFSDASLGNMPQGARSGNAVQMLQERDQMGVAPTTVELEEAFERYGTQLLMLEWKFAKIPRTIQVYGESKQADIRYFKGQDLNGNTHVSVKAGSMRPKSRAATMELMTQMLTLGVLNPAEPREKRLVLEALEVGTTDRLFALIDASRRRAAIENLMFSKPDPDPNFAFPDVMVWDDHQAHYEEHLEFINTDEYELLHPMLKMMFQAHLNKHIQAIAEQAISMATVGAMAGGGAGGGSPDTKPLGKASPPSQNPASKSGPNP